MKDYGVENTWPRQFKIDLKPTGLTGYEHSRGSYGFRKNGDVLLVTNSNRGGLVC